MEASRWAGVTGSSRRSLCGVEGSCDWRDDYRSRSLEDAVEVAQQCPTYEFGGSVEVRPVQDEG